MFDKQKLHFINNIPPLMNYSAIFEMKYCNSNTCSGIWPNCCRRNSSWCVDAVITKIFNSPDNQVKIMLVCNIICYKHIWKIISHDKQTQSYMKSTPYGKHGLQWKKSYNCELNNDTILCTDTDLFTVVAEMVTLPW